MSTNIKPAQRSGMVTQESVSAAADMLEQSGQSVSVRKVIAALGGGSPNAVLPLLQAWKEARPVVKPADIALDPRLIQVLAEQITMEVARAKRDALQEADTIKEDATDVAETGRTAEMQVVNLSAELEQSKSEQQQLAGRLAAQSEELSALKQSSAEGAAQARADAQRERDAAEVVRQSLARAELRLESVPILEKELHEVRGQLQDAQAGRAESDKAAAVAMAQAEGAKARAEALEAAQKQANTEARENAHLARTELIDLRKQLQIKTDEIATLLRQAVKSPRPREVN